jgi:hypothetical protein
VLQRVRSALVFMLGLANDDVGYAALGSEYGGAIAASPTDEALLIVNPSFGDTIDQRLTDAAERIACPSAQRGSMFDVPGILSVSSLYPL